jgi:hypothetical protein
MAEQYVPLPAYQLHPTMVILVSPEMGRHRRPVAFEGNAHMLIERVDISDQGWTTIHGREGQITVNSMTIVKVKR